MFHFHDQDPDFNMPNATQVTTYLLELRHKVSAGVWYGLAEIPFLFKQGMDVFGPMDQFRKSGSELNRNLTTSAACIHDWGMVRHKVLWHSCMFDTSFVINNTSCSVWGSRLKKMTLRSGVVGQSKLLSLQCKWHSDHALVLEYYGHYRLQ